MKKDYFIGIDGGGTKTNAVIEDYAGYAVGRGVGGAANIRLSVEKSWKSIYEAIENALKDSEISLNDSDNIFHIGMGLAGISVAEAKKRFLNTPHPFRTLKLESDAHVACLGAHNGENGAIVSIGTGVIGYMINKDEGIRQGGWGFPHSDTGGGAWIGMEALRLTFSYADGCIPKSDVLEKIFEHFDNDVVKMCNWACSANATDFASVAPFVIKGLSQHDVYSEKIISEAASEMNLFINALRQKGNCDTGQVCYLMGGIAPFLLPKIQVENIALNNDKDVAVNGALLLIKKYLMKH